MKLAYQFDSEMGLWLPAMVIHSWEGIVRATPKQAPF